ncbi:MAG: hypothetical protein PHY29_00205 [Syntrophales bacterium]|nr:hypothetical protein [Syntrophales bacterium]
MATRRLFALASTPAEMLKLSPDRIADWSTPSIPTVSVGTRQKRYGMSAAN